MWASTYRRKNRQNRQWVGFGCWEEEGRLEGGFAKPCTACHGTHSNPVINRNGADEVETKMRNEGCSSRVGLIINKIVMVLVFAGSGLGHVEK